MVNEIIRQNWRKEQLTILEQVDTHSVIVKPNLESGLQLATVIKPIIPTVPSIIFPVPEFLPMLLVYLVVI